MLVRSIAIGLAAVFIGAPSASAGHGPKPPTDPHETPPSAVDHFGDQCALFGRVAIAQGIDHNPAHNHYDFASTAMTCISPDPNIDGAHTVAADGGTDGCPTHKQVSTPPGCEADAEHGEDVAQGWSNDDEFGDTCLATPGSPASNRGDIAVDGDSTNCNYVKFLRGTVLDGADDSTDDVGGDYLAAFSNFVMAWGQISLGGDKYCFTAPVTLTAVSSSTKPAFNEYAVFGPGVRVTAAPSPLGDAPADMRCG